MNIARKVIGNKNTKAGIFYFVGNLFNKAIAFLTIPVFTKILTTAEYGVYTTYESWVAILAVVVGLSLSNTIRNAYVDYKDNLDEYISSITILSLCCLLGAFIIGLWGSRLIGISSVLIFLCIIQAYMSNLTSGYAIKYMMEMNYVMRTLLLALPNAVSAVLSIPVVYCMASDRYWGRIIVEILVLLVIGGFTLAVVFRRGGFKCKMEHWKYALPLAMPMVFHGISINILSNSDRTMITYFRGEEETGVYGLIYSLSMVASVIVSAVENVWIPWFTNRMMLNEKDIINSRVRTYIRFTALLICGLMLIAPEVLVIMADEKFWSGKSMLTPVIMAYFFIFLYSISVNVEYYYKKTKYIAINTLIAGILNIILNWIFIPSYGAMAAAYTTLVSYIASFFLHYFVARKMDRNIFSFSIYITPIAVCFSVMIFVEMFLEYWVIRWAFALFVCVAGGLTVFIRYKNSWKENGERRDERDI